MKEISTLFVNTLTLPGIKMWHKMVIYWATINFCLVLMTEEAPFWWLLFQMVNLPVCVLYIKKNVKEPQLLKDLEE